ncbi:LacI family transcriptional regulator [Ruania suaedae]|uniref:LacI family DNA-binding transcriptional regulator n=1 Tax=Ruania suaedae TaxID=2897774 RepID=UPI001E3232D0|nr:LacI family DNA-binding transcriptional regulator [Ruania suaedae]UFU03043.1 LacI family transcriptional regulator [Ruania suaedae]
MTTMTEVAEAAGVSVMTVSNVLSGRRRVSPETSEKVMRAVTDLHYQVNLTARNLRSGRSGSVALIVPQFDHAYFGALGARVARAMEALGRQVVIEQTSASAAGELSALALARLHMYDGAIFSVVGLRESELDRIRDSIPIVLLGEREVPARFDHVMMGNVEGARLAVAHMFERGSRRVLIAGGRRGLGSTGMSCLRTQGWTGAHQQAGLTVDERLILELPRLDVGEGRAAIAAALAADPSIDGVFAVTDDVAVGALAGVRDAGRSVPADVQVVGFDNLEIGAHVYPELTSIDPSSDWIVDNAVRLLQARMGQDPPADAEHLVSPVRLVERGSTRPVRRGAGPARN